MKRLALPSRPLHRLCFSALMALTLVIAELFYSLGSRGLAPANAQSQPFCFLPPEASERKTALLRASLTGDPGARQQYQALIARDAQQMQQCRAQSWLKNQAVWLRLYECDLQPGVLDELMDRIVSRGYNQVYVEVFYSGQVLLPSANNPTVWPSIVRNPQYANRDLLAESIQKGRERGLKVYAWFFSLNYGYSYGQRADRADALARNGYGKTSLTVVDTSDTAVDIAKGDVDKVFVDPYHPKVRQDYAQLIQQVLQRRPDGMLFDYIRYLKQSGGASVASQSRDLWIYGNASRQTLLARALNEKGKAVIQQYLASGSITSGQLAAIDRQYPNEGEPLWQGRVVPATSGKSLPSASVRQPRLAQDLWLLTVAHAYQGVVDFLNAAAWQVRQQGIPSGAVFFPDGNRRIGRGFDSRMQPWDRFPTSMEWHPMSYGLCGDTNCIVDQVKRVLQLAPTSRPSPVIAGAWTTPAYNRPTLEQQMYAIRQATPQINSISHFDFSWQEPLFTNARRSCKVNLLEAAAPMPRGFNSGR